MLMGFNKNLNYQALAPLPGMYGFVENYLIVIYLTDVATALIVHKFQVFISCLRILKQNTFLLSKVLRI